MDGDDYTFDSVTAFPERVIAMFANQQAQLDALRIDSQQKDLRILKLEQHQAHYDVWLHRLLNPNGDGEMPDLAAPTLFDPQDSI